ncbi:MAG: glycosyltransferase [Kofleriaceae bacterium]|nr:glycosyltransferase [Kofleriaceae bacterium]
MLREHTYAHRALDVEAALGVTSRHAQTRPKSVVVLGLSITSSWGNGHATTYRGLVRALAARGHEVHFLERDVPWYADNRDLPQPAYCRTSIYRSLSELRDRFTSLVRDASVVIVGSYVPEGIEVGDWVLDNARGITAFYDIDTPVTLASLTAGSCAYLAPEHVRRYRLYLSFTGGPTLDRIERDFGSPHARALYCSVDPELYAPDPQTQRWDLAYMGTYSDDRQPIVQRLLVEPAKRSPSRHFVVAGPQYPEHLEWPANVERIEHLGPDHHRAFYNRAAFALNVTRREMTDCGWSPSVRLFEAAACGVPIISDTWRGLDQLFEPDREILLARDTEDVMRYLSDISDDKRREIGRRGRARVLAEHTPAHRVGELERYLDEVH